VWLKLFCYVLGEPTTIVNIGLWAVMVTKRGLLNFRKVRNGASSCERRLFIGRIGNESGSNRKTLGKRANRMSAIFRRPPRVHHPQPKRDFGQIALLFLSSSAFLIFIFRRLHSCIHRSNWSPVHIACPPNSLTGPADCPSTTKLLPSHTSSRSLLNRHRTSFRRRFCKTRRRLRATRASDAGRISAQSAAVRATPSRVSVISVRTSSARTARAQRAHQRTRASSTLARYRPLCPSRASRL
jgi:hypothetical protein